MATRMSVVIEAVQRRREVAPGDFQSKEGRRREIDQRNQQMHVPTEALLKGVHAAVARFDKEVSALGPMIKKLDRADRRAMSAYEEQLIAIDEAKWGVTNAWELAMGRPV
jgi:hypothetical protein